jgi:peptidase M23-like protein/flagellar hook capping protein FlgD
MTSPTRRFCMLALATALALVPRAAAAFEDENPWQPGAPAQPFYLPDQRIIISDPDDGSVLTRSPSRITVNFRRFDFDLDPASVALWIDGVEHTRDLRFWTDVAWYDFPAGVQLGPGEHVMTASVFDHAGVSYLSQAIIQVLFPPCPGGCPWPFAPTSEPSPVANLMEDWQDFDFFTPYFHGGLDIRADAGTQIHACVAGTVVNVDNYPTFGVLKWEIAIQDAQGYIWQYHHVDPASITLKKGDPVAQGQVIGTVVSWPYQVNGYYYDHLHLNVTRWYGPGSFTYPYTDGWVHYNPLNFLTQGSYHDIIAPEEFDMYFAANGSNTPFAADSDPGTPNVNGNIDVLAHLRDHRTTVVPANGQPYELSPYELAYSIVPISTPCGMGFLPRTRLIRFDAMPGGKIVNTQTGVLETIYKYKVNYAGVTGTHYNYSEQNYFYALTNVHNGYPDSTNGSWNTAQLTSLGPLYPDGTYSVKCYAKDWDGNETVTPVTVQVSNGLTYTGICPQYAIDWRWIQPIKLQSASGQTYLTTPPPMPLDFGPLTDGSAYATIDSAHWPAWYFDLPDRGIRIGIGLLAGHQAQIEYVPLLGDVIIDADAEAQVLPPGGLFDPARPSSQPVPLHVTTRLVRDPASGTALTGRAAGYGNSTFELVMNATITVPGAAMALLAATGPADNATWDLSPVSVDPPHAARAAVGLAVRGVPNPLGASGVLRLTMPRPGNAVIDILDPSGRRVRQFFRGSLGPGESAIPWDGRDEMGARLPAGMYLVRVRAGADEARGKIVLVQ